MANASLLFKKVLKFEGGYVNDPADSGGATNKGVTLATWRNMGYDKDLDGDIDADDIKLLSDADAEMVFKRGYWDKWQADKINNQSIAELLVDFAWGSGSWGIKLPQEVLGVEPDGIVGNITISAINNTKNQQGLFEAIKARRIKFLNDICIRQPKNKKFLKGWLNRVNSFIFVP